MSLWISRTNGGIFLSSTNSIYIYLRRRTAKRSKSGFLGRPLLKTKSMWVCISGLTRCTTSTSVRSTTCWLCLEIWAASTESSWVSDGSSPRLSSLGLARLPWSIATIDYRAMTSTTHSTTKPKSLVKFHQQVAQATMRHLINKKNRLSMNSSRCRNR